MTQRKTRGTTESRLGWIPTLFGLVILISGGFLFGLLFGIVSEEPEIVVGHLAGRSQEVAWSEDGPPSVAAAPRPETPLGRETESEARASTAPLRTAPSLPPSPAQPAPQAVASSKPAAAPKAPPARVAPKPKAPPASSSDGSFSVQVGAFSESGSAESLADSLRAKDFPVYVTPSAGSGDGRWRVRVGPYDSRDDADDLAARLKTQEQLPTWVLSDQAP